MRLSLRSVLATAILTTPLVPLAAHATSTPPSCIVSMSPTATETLYAIGAGSQVKAVDRDSNYPVGKLPTTRIDALNPSVEAVAGVCPKKNGKTVKPDLVIISYDANNIKANLTALGIRVVEQDAATSVADALGQIRQLGTLTGHASSANKVASNIQRDIDTAVASVSATAKRLKVTTSSISVYYELDPTLYSITSGTFVGSLLSSLGVTNIADAVATESDYGYPQLSREYVVSTSPKVIFLADTKCCSVNATMVASRTGFSGVRAVKYHHVIALDDDVASRWGPRLSTLMRQIATAINSALTQKSWTK